MSALAQNSNNPSSLESVTAISATARVDYILRFSKQAVLVIDDDISLSSDIGRQFITSLSHELNTAYVTASAKHNDLQVRCRVIEQLFGNILFDPEQSVAVSIINLVKADRQSVSIVIDNAQHLSLQLLHELTQLAEIAKKADYSISVLMLATTDTGQLVYHNQALFHKKLAILQAESGQLVAHNAAIFRGSQSLFSLTPIKKWSIFFGLLSLLSAIVIYQLYQQDSLTFSRLSNSQDSVESQAPVIAQPLENQSAQFVSEIISEQPEFASNTEVLLALTTELATKKNLSQAPVKAMPVDIIDALELNSASPGKAVAQQSVETTAIAESEQVVETIKTETLSITENEPSTVPTISNDEVVGTYLSRTKGFVIQFAAFSSEHALTEFINDYPSIVFERYQKQVNGQPMVIITSVPFDVRAQAEQALLTLPEKIKLRSPWIKSISAINDEINEFQLSQSQENNVTIAN